MLKSSACLVTCVIFSTFLRDASADIIAYTDETSFASAAGPTVLESFETWGVTGAITGFTGDHFTLQHNNGFHAGSTPGEGTYPVDGFFYIEELSALQPNQMTFVSFANPINSFGLYITDYGDFGVSPLIMTLNGAINFEIASPPQGNGNLRYFGVVATGTEVFSTIQLSSDDAIGIDKVSFSAVPEPNSLMLILASIVGGAVRRARNRLTVGT